MTKQGPAIPVSAQSYYSQILSGACSRMGSSLRTRLHRHLIRRKRKLTILMRPSRGSEKDSAKDEGLGADYDVDNAYDANRFITVCKTNWEEWLSAVVAERSRALELVTQYPIPSNLNALFELENISAKMLRVSLFSIHTRNIQHQERHLSIIFR